MRHRVSAATVSAAFLAFLAASTLSGCALSRHPIAPLSAAIPPQELVGKWTMAPWSEQPDGCPYAGGEIRIFPLDTPDKKQIEALVVLTLFDPPGKSIWLVFDGYATRLKNGPFLNLQFVAEGPEANLSQADKTLFTSSTEGGDFIFMAYELQKIGSTPRLTLGGGADGALSKAADSGRLAADSRANGSFTRIVDDGSDHIATYLATLSEKDLYQIGCSLDRVTE